MQDVRETVDLLRSTTLDDDRLVHAVTTRGGGVSPAPWDELNMSWARPDAPENVLENRGRVCQMLHIPLERVVQAGQIHGIGVRAVGADDAGSGAVDRASLLPPSDALISDTPHVYLLACFADCVPLLFYDPHRPAVGVAHAGWRGTVGGIASTTVRAMGEHYGSRPSDIRVLIGPSIGPCCYEVGEEVIAAAEASLPRARRAIRRQAARRAHFDLWQANKDLLIDAGVLPMHIESGELCTVHHAGRFFSHRATGGQTGRFAAIIGLRPTGSALAWNDA